MRIATGSAFVVRAGAVRLRRLARDATLLDAAFLDVTFLDARDPGVPERARAAFEREAGLRDACAGAAPEREEDPAPDVPRRRLWEEPRVLVRAPPVREERAATVLERVVPVLELRARRLERVFVDLAAMSSPCGSDRSTRSGFVCE